MFEGKPPIAAPCAKLEADDTRPRELHPIVWSELTAKLSAVRDLRRELAREADEGDASFDPHGARVIASHHERDEGEGKPDVNPDSLANGKGDVAMDGSYGIDGNAADRGNI
ncbi:MAG: hypothetical protein WBA68_03340 [Alteraurantiacibacter sp.]